MADKHKTIKTIAEINARIRQGKAVVLTAEAMTKAVRDMGPELAAREVDVVTTGTFSPMCSSGLFFNFGQPEPPVIRASRIWLNNVPCAGGVAAVDGFIGATEPTEDDPLNKVHSGRFKYGGGHVIEDLALGRTVHLRAESYGTDCYPRRALERDVTLADLPWAQLVNPRNCYQNYNVAVNAGKKLIYTYMGPLKPGMRNANYATAGCLSPLLNDPYLRTIGMGTRIFLGGGVGYVIGAGSQHVVEPKRAPNGIPLAGSGTLMLKGDLKGMDGRYLRGHSFLGYGCTLAVGVGIPIPVLNAEMAAFTGVSDADILLPVKDYGLDYPNGVSRIIRHVSYEELRSGKIEIEGQEIETSPLTSYTMSREVAERLKSWIEAGEFLLTEPLEAIPSR